MNRFKFWNNCLGWFSFAIAAIVYLLTIEPTLSFWDCGEFIASSYKLQVGHPPGAPFYLLLTKVFSLLTSNPAKVALFINAFSAIVSAFTILFLFWTITHFTRKLLLKNQQETPTDLILILGAGFIGAMAYTFSDSFWFSATEAEVYALSSLFTAVVFWAILKWEEAAGEKFANRWIVLIAYLMGLSIGVHLLNLLAIPAITLVYYFKKFKVSVWGFVLALLCSLLLLAFLQYGIIPGLIKLAALTELFAVNNLNLAFNSGIIIYCSVLFVSLILSLWITKLKGKVVANTILLLFSMVILGYSSYAMIVIRSYAGTVLNENEPNNAFSLLYYLNREQYGDRPLIKGPYYNAPVTGTKLVKPFYSRVGNKYVATWWDTEYEYDPRFVTWFPRMYSSNSSHTKVYKSWTGSKGTPLTVKKGGKQVIEYKPSYSDNIAFFFKYQIGYMYFRYFLWNFSGKQNNIDGNGGLLYGNGISGIPPLDKLFYGQQYRLPASLQYNKGHNCYYLLPLLLGLAGLIFQFKKDKKGFSIILLLFIMTGIAIVIYLNQTPQQARERDYAYVGSFYAFAIWIGLGVASLGSFLHRFFKPNVAVGSTLLLTLYAVPLVMASENWDDHDRSNRYIAHNTAYNYLNSCAPNSILITMGDNDTFPLWYLQEVEGIRRDVRVVNLLLLNADWYIKQMQKWYYKTPPVPMTLNFEQIQKGKRDIIYFTDYSKEYVTLKDAIDFVASSDVTHKYVLGAGDTLDYFPSRNFIFPLDTLEMLKNGTLKHSELSIIEPHITFHINNKYIQKGELVLLDILAKNNWKRPVYFTTPGSISVFGLQHYLRLEGFAYRLTPIANTNTEYFETGSVDSEIMYQNMMEKFEWKSTNNPRVLIDNHCLTTFSVLKLKVNFARLAKQLVMEGKNDSAKKVIEKYFEIIPRGVIPHDVYSFKLAEICYMAGSMDRGDEILKDYRNATIAELRYFYSLPQRLARLTEAELTISKQTLARINSIADAHGRNIKN